MIMIDQLQINVGHDKNAKVSEKEAMQIQRGLEKMVANKRYVDGIIALIKLFAIGHLPGHVVDKIEITIEQ